MSIVENLKNKSKRAALVATAESIVRYVQRDPEKNFDTMMKRLAALDGIFGNQGQFKAMMNWIHENPGTKKWFISLMSRNTSQVRTFLRNFFGNCALNWVEKANFLEKTHGVCPPYTILFSPTMRCNLQCRGCYASQYKQTRSDDMDLGTMEKIITQGKQIGVYFYTILGGEPFVVFDDICTIAKKHKDCVFQIFTNGTMISEEVADRILELKNVVIAFSVNGSKEDTDYMRGPGVYEKVLESIERLRVRKLMYGMSLVLTSKNFETLTSQEFLKFWEDQGVVFGWNFLFMPVGKNPDLSLMPTPEQRIAFGEFIKWYREREPLYIMDFWADAPSVHGCIAGGRRYLHINNKGDIEPCIFAHHATHNIHEHTLMEALKSPFFTFIRMNQPHTDNLLRPCMIIDNPGIWRTACKRFNAKPTEAGAEKIISDPEIIKGLDEYSSAVAKITDPYWIHNYRSNLDDMYERKCSYGEGIDRIEFELNRDKALNNMYKWSEEDSGFIKEMIDSAEYVAKTYGTDPRRHIQLISKEKPGQKFTVDEKNRISADTLSLGKG